MEKKHREKYYLELIRANSWSIPRYYIYRICFLSVYCDLACLRWWVEFVLETRAIFFADTQTFYVSIWSKYGHSPWSFWFDWIWFEWKMKMFVNKVNYGQRLWIFSMLFISHYLTILMDWTCTTLLFNSSRTTSKWRSWEHTEPGKRKTFFL